MVRKKLRNSLVIQSRYDARKKAKKNKVGINRAVKYESRDDERVIIVNTETRIGVEKIYYTIRIQLINKLLAMKSSHIMVIST